MSYTQRLEQRVVELEAALAGHRAASSDSPRDHISETPSLTSDVPPHPGQSRATESLRIEGDAGLSFPVSTSLFQLLGSIRTRHISPNQANQEMAAEKQNLINNAWRERAFEKLTDTPVSYQLILARHGS